MILESSILLSINPYWLIQRPSYLQHLLNASYVHSSPTTRLSETSQAGKYCDMEGNLSTSRSLGLSRSQEPSEEMNVSKANLQDKTFPVYNTSKMYRFSHVLVS